MLLYGLCGVTKEAHVGADRHERASHREVALGVLLHGRENAACLAGRLDALKNMSDGFLHFAVVCIADMPV